MSLTKRWKWEACHGGEGGDGIALYNVANAQFMDDANHTWNGGSAALASANAAVLTHAFLLRRWLLRTSPTGSLTSSAAECCGRR